MYFTDLFWLKKYSDLSLKSLFKFFISKPIRTILYTFQQLKETCFLTYFSILVLVKFI